MTDVLKTIGSLLASNGGTIGLVAGIVLAFVAPIADRYVFRPKRLQYRVLYDSQIGLSPEEFYDSRHDHRPDPQLVLMGDLMSRMTAVVIRFRNIGSKQIDENDFGSPITLSFNNRVIRDLRISEAGRDERDGVVPVDSVRDRVKQVLEFKDSTGTEPPSRDDLPADDGTPTAIALLREMARADMQRRFASAAGTTENSAQPPVWKPDRIVLPGFKLEKRQRFKLLVVLQEPDTNTGDDRTKGVVVNGRIDRREPRNQKKTRRVSWQKVTTAVGTLLTGILLAILLIPPSPPSTPIPVDPAIHCATGQVAIKGSSAFAPIINTIAEPYRKVCADATITVTPTGSNNGVRDFDTEEGRNSHNLLGVLSDGKPSVPVANLVAHPVALLVYTLAVNREVGVDKLTLDQLQGIYSGKFRDWQQIRGGASLPIRIVGRGQESGTRATFERKVLGHLEPGFTSDTCLGPRLDLPAPVIRCERDTTALQIGQIATTPGAIGYADVPAVNAAVSKHSGINPVQLDGRYADVSTIGTGYPFWTVEYLYTLGVPDNDSVLKNLLDYLASGSARAELSDAGYTPCVTKTGLVHPLCDTTANP